MKLMVNDFVMNFSDVGSGPTILLIHGYPLSNRMWEPQIAGLSDKMRVIAPDLRGHGESQTVSGQYSMELFADDLSELLDALGIQEKIVVCGLSMGGYAALGFYRKYAARLQGLILAATRAGDDSPQGRAGRDAAVETARSQGIEIVAGGMLPKMMAPGAFDRDPKLGQKVKEIMMSISLPGMIGDLQGMRDRPDSRPLLENIKIPTLVLHGSEDQLIPPQEAIDMQAAIPGAKLQLIPNAGHLVNLEQPEAFNAAVRDFISELNPG